MQAMTINNLSPDGMRRMKIIGDAEIQTAKYEVLIPAEARPLAVFVPGCDDVLGLFSLEITFPVYGPCDVFYHGPKKFRRLMFVNFAYAARVSDCIELARAEYFARTHYAPGYAFVQSLPEGKDGELIHDCVLLSAEWMPARCVAIGGRDG